MWIDLLSHFAFFTVMDCTTSHIISTAKCWQKHRLKYTLVNCHHDLRDRENSYILLYFPLTILPSANSCRYWGTERRKNVRAEACNTFTLLFSQLRDANPKFTFWEHFMTEAMSWTRLKQLLPWLAHGKTERMPGQKLAWPALALVWPQAWSILWGWPGLGLCGLMCLPGSLSVAWVCESCFMLLAGPLTCLTITLDRHHKPMFAMLTKGFKEIQRHAHICKR